MLGGLRMKPYCPRDDGHKRETPSPGTSCQNFPRNCLAQHGTRFRRQFSASSTFPAVRQFIPIRTMNGFVIRPIPDIHRLYYHYNFFN